LKTTHLKITKLQSIIARLSKIWTFDLEGQGHLWMKVKVSVFYCKFLSKGLLWPSMKTIHQELKRKSYDPGTYFRTATATPPRLSQYLYFKKKSRAKKLI
jgi:hypothetical protein